MLLNKKLASRINFWFKFTSRLVRSNVIINRQTILSYNFATIQAVKPESVHYASSSDNQSKRTKSRFANRIALVSALCLAFVSSIHTAQCDTASNYKFVSEKRK